MRQSRLFEVFEEQKGKRVSIFTKNLIRGNPVYGERITREGGIEYREWDPMRSKLCATIMKGATNVGIRKGDTVLYLGAASGTTVSHVSDMVGDGGWVFALDFAPRVLRDLVAVAEKRKNIIPIMADANKPKEYAGCVVASDVVFQDVAQRNQSEIFLKNCKMFLRPGGYGLLAVKARSVDISRKPRDVYRQVKSELEKEITIIDYRELAPFEKDHCMFICKKK